MPEAKGEKGQEAREDAKATKAADDQKDTDAAQGTGSPVLLDDPRLLYTVPAKTDFKTGLNTSDIVPELRKGCQMFVWKQNPRANFSTTGRVLQGLVQLSPLHDKLLVLQKKKLIDSMDIGKLKDVRTRHETALPESLEKDLPENYQDLQIILVVGRGLVEVDYFSLVPPDVDTRTKWILVLRGLSASALQNRVKPSALYLKRQYLSMVKPSKKNGDQVPLSALQKHFHVKGAEAKQMLQTVEHLGVVMKKKLSTDNFTVERFQELHTEMQARPEIASLFARVAGSAEAKHIDPARFLRFLVDDQAMDEETTNAHALIRSCEPDKSMGEAGKLSVAGFTNFLLSGTNDIYHKNHLQDMDMDQPLSHYWVESSHNSYLTGHQLIGTSAVEMYRQILLSGCRCIELDLWDGPKGQPIIYHGFTLTTKIQFVDVVQCINDFAFAASEYPLVLSLEDHCSTEQQRFIAETFVKVFGEKLIREDPRRRSNITWDIPKQPNDLPSPKFLRGKILVKHKKIPDEKAEEEAKEQVSVMTLANEFADNGVKIEDDVEYESEEESEEAKAERESELDAMGMGGGLLKPYAGSVSGKGIAQELSDLVLFTEARKFKNFLHSRVKYNCNMMSSFPERKGMKLLQKFPREWVVLSENRLNRTYPHGTRFSSSNYSPLPFWSCGVQMVSLNYQTPGICMQLNRAMFNRGPKAGLILKPRCMRKRKMGYHPLTDDPINGVDAKKLTVQIISGQHLFPDNPKNVFSIQVETFGCAKDCQSQKARECVGTSPLVEQTLVFEKLRLPEFVFVRFSVPSHEKGAHYILPLEALKSGYRHVYLKDEHGEGIPLASLFVHIRVETLEVVEADGSKVGNSASTSVASSARPSTTTSEANGSSPHEDKETENQRSGEQPDESSAAK